MDEQPLDPGVSDTLSALVGMLWGTSHHARLWPGSTPPPAGWQRVESFRVLPRLSAPRFLMPDTLSSSGQGTLLTSYNLLRYFGARMARATLAGAARLEVLNAHIGERAHVIVPEAEAHLSLRPVIAAQLGLGTDEIAFAIPVRRAAGGVRPTVTVALLDGTPVAFVKVGRRDIHRRRLITEHESLSELAAAPADSMRTPRPLFSFAWQGRRVIGSSPLPAAARRVDLHRAEAAWHYAESLHSSQPVTLPRMADSMWFADLRTRADRAPVDLRAPLVAALGDLAAAHGQRHVAVGRIHGDWLPWNLAWDEDGTLVAWDWETSQAQAPLLLDALQWEYGLTTMRRGGSVGAGAQMLRERLASQHYRDGGVVPIFLAEQAVRRAEECTPGFAPELELAGEALDALRSAL